MATTRARLDANGTLTRIGSAPAPPEARFDPRRVDATTANAVAEQAADDEAEGRQVVAAHARRVRRRTGLSRTAFAARIGVPLATVRDWEAGRVAPIGPARALLRVLDHAPEAALAALR